jgi:hypothetical protein
VLAEWSPGDRASCERAEATLAHQLELGLTAMRVHGATHEPVTELPIDADLVVVTTAMGGG